MLSQGIVEIDVHGMSAEEAVRAVGKKVKAAGNATYRIRVIHGYHGGTAIREAIKRELGYGLEPKIKKICGGDNPGITELILREF